MNLKIFSWRFNVKSLLIIYIIFKMILLLRGNVMFQQYLLEVEIQIISLSRMRLKYTNILLIVQF